MSADENFLEFNLENGIRYQEKGMITDSNTEFTRLEFKKFKKLFDLSILKKQQTNDSAFRGNTRMLSARQLQTNIDSLDREKDSIIKRMLIRQSFNNIYPASLVKKKSSKQNMNDSISYAKLIPLTYQNEINQLALNMISSVRNDMFNYKVNIDANARETKNSLIEWNRKYAISLSCLILFFIGAPLGAIIRKGGIGLPLVFAILFFLIFHLLIMFGEKFAGEGMVSPALGMWLPAMALSPVGFFLTYKAMNDSVLFNKEYYLNLYKKIFLFKKKTQPNI